MWNYTHRPSRNARSKNYLGIPIFAFFHHHHHHKHFYRGLNNVNYCKAPLLAACVTMPPITSLYLIYRVVQKPGTLFVRLNFIRLNFINIDRFSDLVHCLNQENICNNTANKYPMKPQVCRYTTLRNVSVLKATTEYKTTSVTTQFKKLTTGNNVFIVSVII